MLEKESRETDWSGLDRFVSELQDLVDTDNMDEEISQKIQVFSETLTAPLDDPTLERSEKWLKIKEIADDLQEFAGELEISEEIQTQLAEIADGIATELDSLDEE